MRPSSEELCRRMTRCFCVGFFLLQCRYAFRQTWQCGLVSSHFTRRSLKRRSILTLKFQAVALREGDKGNPHLQVKQLFRLLGAEARLALLRSISRLSGSFLSIVMNDKFLKTWYHYHKATWIDWTTLWYLEWRGINEYCTWAEDIRSKTTYCYRAYVK
jgi:hypothetical protein